MRISDWSSDVCSSDLLNPDKAIFDRKGFNQWIVRDQVGHLVIQISHEFQMTRMAEKEGRPTIRFILCHRIADRTAWNFDSLDRKSVVSGKSVSVRVALGGRSIIKNKHKKKQKK